MLATLRVLPDDISCPKRVPREASLETPMLMTDQQVKDRQLNSAQQAAVFLAGSGFVTGSRTLASEEIDRAFGMPIGKLRSRAGIELSLIHISAWC